MATQCEEHERIIMRIERAAACIEAAREDIRQMRRDIRILDCDIKKLLAVNGVRRESIGELRGKVIAISSIISAAVSGAVAGLIRLLR